MPSSAMNSLDLQVRVGERVGEDDWGGREVSFKWWWLLVVGGGCWWLLVVVVAVAAVVVAAPGYPGWDDKSKSIHPSSPKALRPIRCETRIPVVSANFLRLVWIYNLDEETRGFDHENPQLHLLSTSSQVSPDIKRHFAES